jgi:hypothetical protein
MKAYELIDSPDKWCKEGYAKDKDGFCVDPRDDSAVQFCAVGACARASNLSICEIEDKIREKKWLQFSGYWSSVEWNDCSDWQTVYDALRALDI